MKKITLFLHHQEVSELTARLQGLGVLHLQPAEAVQGGEPSDRMEQLLRQETALRQAADILRALPAEKTGQAVGSSAPAIQDPQALAARVLEIRAAAEKLRQHADALEKEFRLLEPWGNFEPALLDTLSEKGLSFHFYTASETEWKQFRMETMPPDEVLAVVSRHNRTIHAVHIFPAAKEELMSLPFVRMQPPSRSAVAVRAEQAQLNHQIDLKINELEKLHSALPLLEAAQLRLDDELALETAKAGCEQTGEASIWVMSGWVPEGQEAPLRQLLDQQQIAFVMRAPTPEDRVPVMLKNSAYPRLFENVTKIFQLPNYFETDLTPLVAVFYPLFFAYCLGDMGYGLVLAAIAGVGYFTFLKGLRQVALLGVLLGIITSVVGIVKSGSVFGMSTSAHTEIPFFNWLASFLFIPDDQAYPFNAFNVALLIGVIQILTGVLAAIYRKIRYLSAAYALAPFGKLLMIISTIILFLGGSRGVEVFIPLLDVAKAGLFIGILLVLFFHDLKLPIVQRIGGGVLPIFFIFTGMLGDILSYVRLFALGVSSSVLGLVVNQIGMDMAGSAGWIVAGAFLIFGHGLNFALALLGSIVHPLRLTFVEFYNNAEFEGGGVPYNPFRKKSEMHPEAG